MTYLPNSALLSVMRVSGIAIATRLQAHQTEPKISVTSPFTAERSARYRLQQTTVPAWSRPYLAALCGTSPALLASSRFGAKE
jgi:hypothetical protein